MTISEIKRRSPDPRTSTVYVETCFTTVRLIGIGRKYLRVMHGDGLIEQIEPHQVDDIVSLPC